MRKFHLLKEGSIFKAGKILKKREFSKKCNYAMVNSLYYKNYCVSVWYGKKTMSFLYMILYLIFIFVLPVNCNYITKLGHNLWNTLYTYKFHIYICIILYAIGMNSTTFLAAHIDIFLAM